MPKEIEYTFLGTNDTLETTSNNMSKAVRVKLSVSDKLQRVYGKYNLSSPVVKKETKKEDKVLKSESLIDDSKENQEKLNKFVNAMHNQKNVPMQKKRQVLFTAALTEKTARLGDKFLKIENRTIPGNWDEIAPSLLNTFEKMKANAELPKEEVKPAVENKIEEKTPAIEEKTPVKEETKPIVEEKKEMPTRTFDFVSENVTRESRNIELNTFKPVEETKVPTFEFIKPVDKVEEKVEEPKVIEFKKIDEEKVSDKKVEIDDKVKSMPIEDKINELLNKRFDKVEEPKEIKLDKPVEEEKHVEEKTEPVVVNLVKNEEKADDDDLEMTESLVKARLYRIKNTINEAEAKNVALNAKLETANKSLEDERSKNAGYLITIRELTKKNNELEKSNNRLNDELEKSNSRHKENSSLIQGQLEYYKRMALNRKLEIDRVNAEAELKVKEAEKAAQVRIDIAVKDVEARSKERMNRIYKLFVESLPDVSKDDSNDYKKVA